MANVSTGEKLVRSLRRAGHEPYSYSGRGMFGERCVAITVPHLQAVSRARLRGARTDSMGKSDIVVYWPAAEWPAEPAVTADARLRQAVADYTGREVRELKVHADPEVKGTFAVRATVAAGSRRRSTAVVSRGATYDVDFLVVGVPLERATSSDLSECEFTAWPPTSGSLRCR